MLCIKIISLPVTVKHSHVYLLHGIMSDLVYAANLIIAIKQVNNSPSDSFYVIFFALSDAAFVQHARVSMVLYPFSIIKAFLFPRGCKKSGSKLTYYFLCLNFCILLAMTLNIVSQSNLKIDNWVVQSDEWGERKN